MATENLDHNEFRGDIDVADLRIYDDGGFYSHDFIPSNESGMI